MGTKGFIWTDCDLWVTMYKLKFLKGGQKWNHVVDQELHEPRIFDGNTDCTTLVKHDITPSFQAQYVRLEIVSFNGHWPGLRWELYGCH